VVEVDSTTSSQSHPEQACRAVVGDGAAPQPQMTPASASRPITEEKTAGAMPTAVLLTRAELAEAIAERERSPRDNEGLTRACITALRSGGRLPRVPLRVVWVWSPTGAPIPPELDGIFIDPSVEVVVRSRRLPAPYVGRAALIADAAVIPAPQFNHEARERVAEALAAAMLKEVP
jgi:hypothetical protein